MKKRLVFSGLISIFLIVVLLIGSTYSLFVTSNVDDNLNVYKTGNLDITYTVSDNNKIYSSMIPVSSDAVERVKPYRVTVNNVGNVPYKFNVILNNTTVTDSVDSKYIVTKVGKLEPKTLDNCENGIIKKDVIVPAGESAIIDVRVYLNETIQNTEIGKSFLASLSIDGMAIYNESVEIDNSILMLSKKTLVSFDANGGVIAEGDECIEVESSSKYNDFPVVSRVGYTFVGWFTEDDVEVTEGNDLVTEDDHTLEAKWSPKTYTVSFDKNSCTATPSVASKTVTYNEEYGELPITSRENYTFVGWFTKPVGGQLVTSTSKVLITENQTLYAFCSQTEYVVSFDANKGEVEPSSIIVAKGEVYGELPVPTRGGYTFGGWYTDPENGELVTENTVVGINGPQTLYAHWNAISYTVTFDANGGGTPSMESKIVTYDQLYGDLATIGRSGYSFDGWYSEAIGGTKIESTSKVVALGAHTLYAHWSTNSYTVTFDANGEGATVSPSSYTVNFGEEYGEMPTPVRAGYIFDGWFTESSGGSQVTSSTAVIIAGAHTLYAHWSANIIDITLNENGCGTITGTNPFYAKYGTDDIYTSSAATTVATAPGLTVNNGYTFNGWYTAASGGSKVLTTAGTLTGTAVSGYTTTNTWVATSAKTLYAQCSKNTYNITLNKNGGTTDGTTTIYEKYGTGIYLDSELKNAMTASANAITKPTKSYTITYNANSQGATYTGLPSTSSATFKGYYTAISGGTQMIKADGYINTTNFTNTKYTASTTLYAQWTNTSITLPAITKTGYTCKWAEGSTSGTQYGGGESRTISANTTYYAVCTANVVKVNIYLDGNAWGSNGMKVTLYNGTTATSYTATGSGGSQLSISGVPNGTYNIYAGVSNLANTTLLDSSVDVTVNNNSPSAVTINYYTISRSQGPNTTLTTRYNSTSSSSGTSFTNSVVLLKGTSVWVKATSSTGYAASLKHGSTSMSSSGSTFTVSATETITSSAIANSYTVIFDARNGSIQQSSMNVTYGSKYGNLPTPTWVGHTFDGWYTSLSFDTEITSDSIVSITSTQTLYAKYYSNIDLNYQDNLLNTDITSWGIDSSSTINVLEGHNGQPAIRMLSGSTANRGFKVPIVGNLDLSADYSLEFSYLRNNSTAYSSYSKLNVNSCDSSGTCSSPGIIEYVQSLKNNESYRVVDYDWSTGGKLIRNANNIYFTFDEKNVGPLWISDVQLNTYKSFRYVYGYEGFSSLPTPERDGYSFDGWYDIKDTPTVVIEDVTGGNSNSERRTMLTDLEYNTTYTVSMKSAKLNSGSGTQFMARVEKAWDSSTSYSSVNVAYGNDISFNITTPELDNDADASNDPLSLVFYSGLRGSTTGNKVTFTNVFIRKTSDISLQSHEIDDGSILKHNDKIYAHWTPNS